MRRSVLVSVPPPRLLVAIFDGRRTTVSRRVDEHGSVNDDVLMNPELDTGKSLLDKIRFRKRVLEVAARSSRGRGSRRALREHHVSST